MSADSNRRTGSLRAGARRPGEERSVKQERQVQAGWGGHGALRSWEDPRAGERGRPHNAGIEYRL